MAIGKNITREDILEHQRYLKGFLSENVPEADLTDGSFLNDVVVRSMSYVLALFEKEAESVKARLYLNDIGSAEDTTASQILDDIASNYLLERKDGTLSRGIVTVSVSSNESSVVIRPYTRFIKSRGVNFVYAGGLDGETSLVISPQDMTEEPTGNYTFKVSVVGEVEFVGSELSPGEFESVSPSIPNMVSVFNERPFSVADSVETNSDFAERIKSSMTHRGFASSNGIVTHLLNSVPTTSRVDVITAADPLMRRDLLQVGSLTSTFKTLGKYNIYSASGNLAKSKSYTIDPNVVSADAQGLVTIEISRDDLKNISHIDRVDFKNQVCSIYDSVGSHVVTLKNNTLVDVSDPDSYIDSNYFELIYLDIEDPTQVNSIGSLYARSSKERPAFKVKLQNFSESVTIHTVCPEVPDLVDAEVYDESNKVPGHDALSYTHTLKVIYPSIKFFKNTEAPDEVPIEWMKTDLSAYINTLAAQQNDVNLSDVYSYILEEYSTYVSGIDFSESSFEMSTLLPNGVTVYFEIGTSTDLSSDSTRSYYLLPGDSGIRKYEYLPTSYLQNLQVGNSTCMVFCSPQNIDLSEVAQ